MPSDENEALDPAIHAQARRAIAMAVVLGAGGNQAEFARRITAYFRSNGIKRSIGKNGVKAWLKGGTLLAEHYWSAVEHVTEGGVTRRWLRPDLFGPFSEAHVKQAEQLARRHETAA